jgi:hypothetical protein
VGAPARLRGEKGAGDTLTQSGVGVGRESIAAAPASREARGVAFGGAAQGWSLRGEYGRMCEEGALGLEAAVPKGYAAA